ncbi:MAG: flavodoxin family protein [Methanocorpusculum sp.]|nr:flavodoxin family protein [Methanocorpusculum sp.]
MKIYAVNGSPRKNKNTAVLLQKALDGAAEGRDDVKTELIHLYDYAFTGCTSCFRCKKVDGRNYGTCPVKDDLQPVLKKLSSADAVIFGSPIYFGNVTGEMKAFLERLLFPYFVYAEGYPSIAPKKFRTAFIYTMNVTEEAMKQLHYQDVLGLNEFFIEKVFSKPESLYAFDTYQFNNYAKYKADCFSEPAKAKVRAEQFPRDCEAAAALGKRLAEKMQG